ncbi:single-stranded DNA-binding protein [Williamsia sp. 1135]|uniref:single-stranded DNA-binding protein n=1 Tax=Williamsia sp. 1135 TaxID=1889262 RepID=UPI000A120051|nr:single-stranded DNA-binding protein [Williamsia sp. 1135]ORM37080.1 single-stranded DNA-binding protein [Williamsia sp. 1135]
MYETYTTVIGTVISQPRRRQTAAGEGVFSFRMACNSRRLDKRNGEWVDGPTLYLTVSCWRKLIDGVASVVAKGRPVIAHGQIKTNEYVADNGERRADLEMTATTVGLDLSRCEVTYVGATTRGGPGLAVSEPSDVVAQPAERTGAAAA